MDDDASPEVLETMEAAAYIHVDATITPGVGLSSNNIVHESVPDHRRGLASEISLAARDKVIARGITR